MTGLTDLSSLEDIGIFANGNTLHLDKTKWTEDGENAFESGELSLTTAGTVDVSIETNFTKLVAEIKAETGNI